jgi:hypothetical protein
MKKLKWLYYTPVMIKPVGLVHIIFADDTENVLDANDVLWAAGWESFDDNWETNSPKKVVTYICVNEDYKNDFDNGLNKAVDSTYLFTSKLLKKIS